MERTNKIPTFVINEDGSHAGTYLSDRVYKRSLEGAECKNKIPVFAVDETGTLRDIYLTNEIDAPSLLVKVDQDQPSD